MTKYMDGPYYTFRFFSRINPNAGYTPLDMTKIRAIFDARGNWRETKADEATFMFINVYSYADQKKSYSFKADITNVIKQYSEHNLYKSTIYSLLHDYDPDLAERFMMRQITITPQNWDKIDRKVFNKLLILKPIHSWAGAGIRIIENYADYLDYFRSVEFSAKTRWVLAEYITNPLLFHSRKFHLRVPFLYYKRRGWIGKEYRIITAAKPYQSGDWTNKAIHDSHLTGSIENTFFPPPNSESVADILALIDQLFHSLTTIMNVNNFRFECYSSPHCFTVYGADIMITDDHQIKLLEVNSRAGFTHNGSYMERMINDLAIIVLDDLYEPALSIDTELQFFKEITQLDNQI